MGTWQNLPPLAVVSTPASAAIVTASGPVPVTSGLAITSKIPNIPLASFGKSIVDEIQCFSDDIAAACAPNNLAVNGKGDFVIVIGVNVITCIHVYVELSLDLILNIICASFCGATVIQKN